MLVKVKKPTQEYPHVWPDILKDLEHSRSKVKVTKVYWKCPKEGWVKYNTDRASRGNLSISSYASFLIDE